MKISIPDDGSISSEAQVINQRNHEVSIPTPDVFSPGMVWLAEIEMKAKSIYPDHAESRKAYIREMTAVEINRLHAIIDAPQTSPDGSVVR